ncbi:MAG: hypothetical protein JXA66_07635 [Oligoflexia bacterium]|nr:hypothetical protein [Oligoflexia bacterium]
MSQLNLRYKLDIEQIIEYMKVPVEDKLNWLEELLEFTQKAQTQEAKEIAKKFKDEHVFKKF